MTREQMIAHLELRGWHPVYSGAKLSARRGNVVMVISGFRARRKPEAVKQPAGITIRMDDWHDFIDDTLEAFVTLDLESLGAS